MRQTEMKQKSPEKSNQEQRVNQRSMNNFQSKRQRILLSNLILSSMSLTSGFSKIFEIKIADSGKEGRG